MIGHKLKTIFVESVTVGGTGYNGYWSGVSLPRISVTLSLPLSWPTPSSPL